MLWQTSSNNSPAQKKSSHGDPSRQPSVVEISDEDEDDQEKLDNGKTNDEAECSEAELS